MSPGRQIALLARELAETKAALAAKSEGKELENFIGNPFELVAGMVGHRAATVLFIRFDIESLGLGLCALAVMLEFKDSPPPLRPLLAKLDKREQGKWKLRWRSRLQSDREVAERSLAIARSRAKEGAALRGRDLERAFGDPFQFLAERIGERAAVAFCIRFDSPLISMGLRILGWMHVYQVSPPSIDELLSRMVGDEGTDFQDMPPASPRIQ